MDEIPGYWPLTEWVEFVTELHGAKIEEWMRLYIRDKPRWLPSFVWKWLIRRTVLLVDRRGKWASKP